MKFCAKYFFFILQVWMLTFCRASAFAESVYFVQVDAPDLYGEIYHLTLALGVQKDAYIYLPHVSGVNDPQAHHRLLLENSKSARADLVEKTNSLNSVIDNVIRELEHFPRDVTGTHIEISTRGKTLQFPLYNRASLLSALETHAQLSLPLTAYTRNAVLAAYLRQQSAAAAAQAAEHAIAGESKAFLFESYLKDAGLENRIVHLDSGSPLEPAIGLKGEEQVLQKLKGAPHSTHDPAPFTEPLRQHLADSTSVFVNQFKEEPTAIEKGRALLLRKKTTSSDVIEYAKKNIISLIPKNRKGLIVWNRQKDYQSSRNMTESTMLALLHESIDRGFTPILFGPEIPKQWVQVQELIASAQVVSSTNHWKTEPFHEVQTSITKQLELFRYLAQEGEVSGQVGMVGGALDGVAMVTGLPTVALTIPGSDMKRAGSFANLFGDSFRIVGSDTPPRLLLDQIENASKGKVSTTERSRETDFSLVHLTNVLCLGLGNGVSVPAH